MQEVVAGRYELGRELGRGGMARVVEGRDLRLHRQVAVKLLPDADGTGSFARSGTPSAHISPSHLVARRRFVREARAAASFSHPHAVAVFDAGDADGVLYLVMELIDGESLATRLGRAGPLPVAEALDVTDQVLQALAAAHHAGIVHRDVKPGNVLVTAGGVAKLADFGIAKRFDDLAADVTSTGHFVGTPSYLAPEQVAGAPATPATDLYSTGVLLFEMLTGGPPFAAESPIATALAHRDAPVPDVRSRRADVPEPVAAAIATAMAKDPASRFADADAMRNGLRRAERATMAGRPLPHPAPPVATPPPAPTEVLPVEFRRRSRAWWWIAATLALAVTAAVVALGRGEGRDDAQIGSAGSAVAPTAVGTPAPAPATTAVPIVVAPTVPPTVASTAPAQLAAADLDELIALIASEPASFGGHTDELRADLERIADRRGSEGNGNRIDRLVERVDEWAADGSLEQGPADLVRTVLTAVAGEGGNKGGNEDDD